MGGEKVSRARDRPEGSSGGSGTKDVDANISIAPNGVNEVGTAHTFTITVNALPDGASPVSFGTITPSVSPAPGSQSEDRESVAYGKNADICARRIIKRNEAQPTRRRSSPMN